jgi:hypothetical protein
MRSDMRKYWRDPGYWRWWLRTVVIPGYWRSWWEDRVSGETKVAIAVVAAVAFGIAGYLSADRLAATEDAAMVTTRRVVTVVRKTGTFAPPEVVTKPQTTTQPGETDVVTVRRDGRRVVVRVPGATVTEALTVRGPVEQRVVTNARTDTVVRTERADRLTTVTAPGTTGTVTRDVTQPARVTTVTTPGTTETVTREVTQPARTVTETNAVTVTDEVTITEEVTVTETVRGGPPPPTT